MLPIINKRKTWILSTPKEFDRVFRHPDSRLNAGKFLILASQNQLPYNRLGMVISKKNVARSVDRNKLKRLIRESFRAHDSLSLDMVVLAAKGAGKLENRVIFTSLDKAWKQLSEKWTKESGKGSSIGSIEQGSTEQI